VSINATHIARIWADVVTGPYRAPTQPGKAGRRAFSSSLSVAAGLRRARRAGRGGVVAVLLGHPVLAGRPQPRGPGWLRVGPLARRGGRL